MSLIDKTILIIRHRVDVDGVICTKEKKLNSYVPYSILLTLVGAVAGGKCVSYHAFEKGVREYLNPTAEYKTIKDILGCKAKVKKTYYTMGGCYCSSTKYHELCNSESAIREVSIEIQDMDSGEVTVVQLSKLVP